MQRKKNKAFSFSICSATSNTTIQTTQQTSPWYQWPDVYRSRPAWTTCMYVCQADDVTTEGRSLSYKENSNGNTKWTIDFSGNKRKKKKQCGDPLWATRPPRNPSGVMRIRSNKSYVSSRIIFILKCLAFKVGLNCLLGCTHIKQIKTSSQNLVKRIKKLFYKTSKTIRSTE